MGCKIQTDHVIEARRPDYMLITNKTKSAQLLNLHAPLIAELKAGRKIR